MSNNDYKRRMMTLQPNMEPIVVRHTEWPLINRLVEAGQSVDVVTDKAIIDVRPLMLVLNIPSSDLFICNIVHEQKSMMMFAGQGDEGLPSTMFSQLIPRECRIQLDIPTVSFGGRLIVKVKNHGPNVARVSGFFDCLASR